ncbi:Uncharacterised protein [Mycobacteroides abscessus subsp. abscessus]|nr:Uncharacterised protein [Mycobacteroides abscessus subsp. abscessus]
MALGGDLLHLGQPDGADLTRLGGSPPDDGVRHVGGDHQDVGAHLLGQQGGGQVLVDDCLDALHRPVVLADDRNSDSIAGASSTSCGLGEATTRRQPFSPRSSHCWPKPIMAWASAWGR